MKIIRRFIYLFIVIAYITSYHQSLYAISSEQIKAIDSGARYFNTEESCSAISTTLSGDDVTAEVFNFFTGKGLPDFQAAAVLGNMYEESGIQPQRLQGTESGVVTPADQVPRNQAGKAWGLVQWDRAHKMIDPVTKAEKDPNQVIPQLEFLWGQLNNEWPEGWGGAPEEGFNEKSAGDRFKATTDIATATESFMRYYERPFSYKSLPDRIAKAVEILDRAKSGGISTSVTTSSLPSSAYIIGDSITHGAAGRYTESLSSRAVDSTISAVTSRSWNGAGTPALGATGTTGSGKDALNTDRDTVASAEAIVIALGTNGGLASNPIGDIISDVKSINPTAPIYWVNIAISSSDSNSIVQPFNQKLAEEQTAGRITVIDWAKEVDQVGGGVNNPHGLLADGVHPSEAGYNKLTDLVSLAITDGLSTSSQDSCASNSSTTGNYKDLSEATLAYAWPEYKGRGYIERKEEYAAAITKAKGEGRYIGGTVNGVEGIDCGGFVTTLLVDSGFDTRYNSDGRGGATMAQWSWLKENWESLGTINSTADLQPGDVAINSGHTFVFVGDIPGFESSIASASYSTSGNGRAPMAGKESINGDGVVWYRKK